MNIGVLEENRVICRYNLRGMCRFGGRCRNIHIAPEKLTEKLEAENKITPTIDTDSLASSLGACALSPKKSKPSPKGKEAAASMESPKEDLLGLGPSTSSAEEAVALVKKVESAHKTCGICFDIILQKTNRLEQTFGILPNCNHCFCFTCIRKWRQSKEFELDVAKACPECRTASDFVYPSKFWVENKEEKAEFIDTQKQRMKKQNCRYFRQGKGKCPFGNTCLYLHALPNGKTLDVGPPRPRRRRPSGIDSDLVHQILFWLNDDDLDDDDDDIDDFELDLSDPCIAMQYYDHGDIRRYIAMDRLMRGDDGDDDDDSDYEFLLF